MVGGGLVAGSPQQIVDAFNLAESVYRRAWVEQAREPMDTATGSYPVKTSGICDDLYR